MKIFRFCDKNNNVCFGTHLKNDTVYLIEEGIVKKDKRVKIHKYLPPVEPPAIFCIGLNYRAHARETGMSLPDYPVVFMKNPASVTGHLDEIVLPASCRDPLQVDYEAELAVVIGKTAKNVSEKEALDFVAGYTIANDVSARYWQQNAGGGQWVRGKSFDTFCPLGPGIVTADEIENPGNLAVKTLLNGQLMQESNTSDMLFSVKRLIEYLSEDTSLLPGTLILTGTPEGVGFTRKPAVYLKPGDTLEISIEKIGTLVNKVK